MIAAIIGAEVAFWVLLGAGLALRYLTRARRASTIVLACVPLVDVALLALVAIDIAGGAEPAQPHALAAMYLGFTVAFGHSVIAWADVAFRHRFAGGPAPATPRKGSRLQVRMLWREWTRVVLAAVIASVVLGVMIVVDGEPVPASLDEAALHPYWSGICLLWLITAIWLLAGPAFAGFGDTASPQRVTKQEARGLSPRRALRGTRSPPP